MKVKFLKNALGYKIDNEVELDDTEAKELVDSGKAVEVKVDAVAVAMKGFEDKINAKIAEGLEVGIAAVTEKMGKAFADRKPIINVGSPNSLKDINGGFKNESEFFHSVKNHFTPGAQQDDRVKALINKAGSPTESGATTIDGGATMPPGFSPNLIDPVAATQQIFPLVSSLPITTRTMNIPVIKHYDFSNAGGATAAIVASYKAEGAAGAPSKAQYENLPFSLKTLYSLIPTTEELEEDTGIALGSFLNKEAGRWINESITKSILTTVSGGPTAINGHASVAVVLRNTVSNIKFADVLGMFAAFYGDITKAVWVVHPTVLPQLGNMTSGNYNVFIPAGVGPNGSSAPFGTLLGRPIIVNGYCNAMGTQGDICLYDFTKYQAVYRSGGIEAAMSVDVWFDSYQKAYRFAYRWDGKPQLTGPITLGDGVSIVSPFVQLKATTT